MNQCQHPTFIGGWPGLHFLPISDVTDGLGRKCRMQAASSLAKCKTSGYMTNPGFDILPAGLSADFVTAQRKHAISFVCGTVAYDH